MRKVILIIIAFGLLITLALVLTACPRTTELEPGQGEVATSPEMPAMQEVETEIPPEGVAATPEELEDLEPAEDEAEAGDEEATPDEEEGADEEDTEEVEETEDAADEAATE